MASLGTSDKYLGSDVTAIPAPLLKGKGFTVMSVVHRNMIDASILSFLRNH